jgi:predicted aspartyl protease
MRTSAPHPRSHCNQSPRSPTKVVATKTGRVNYTTIEDVPKGERILAGTFSLNGHPVVILFDSGASHDFISKACTQKCQLVIEHMRKPYMILTPGGNIITKQLVINAPLNLGGKVYKMHLIILDGQGIDVILGMNWMRDHKALLDTASRTV